MAKRNCRRTMDEAAIHDRAVRLRRMTDEQLVHYVEDRVEKAGSEGFNRGRAGGFDPAEFVEGIGMLPGVGKATMGKIRAYAQEGGWIDGGKG